MNIGTLFSGFGGVDIGAQAAGLELAWGVEFDADIAAVAHANLPHDIRVANLLDCDPRTFDRVDVLHASPPCPNFSIAKAGGVETALDIALANKVAEFVTVLQPRIFTLENVWAYRGSRSWHIIQDALHGAGYWVNTEHVNSADMGGLKLCPLHDTIFRANSASVVESRCQHEIAPDIVAMFATMQPDAQAVHLAWDAVAHLVRVTRRDIAVDVALQEIASSANSAVTQTTTGKVDGVLMNAAMFVSGLTENMSENIVLLLKICLDAPLVKAKWFTISTETQQITLRLILRCIQAMSPTYQSITKRGRWSTPIGASGTSGIDICPLCHHESVPQTRKRMIVRAIKGGFVPYLPEPVPWVGWYAAIEDLLPTLPESQFAPWQLARLPELLQTTLVGNSGFHGTVVQAKQKEPSFTVMASHGRSGVRAFIVPGGNNSFPVRGDGEPVFTITNSQAGGGCRAFIAQVQGEGGDGVRYDAEPMQTVAANHGAGKYRAWLVDSTNARTDGGVTVRGEVEPSLTVTAGGPKHPVRALLATGRVVSMSPRCLARFQSFPDWYELPSNNRLAAKGIGNAVPPLLYQRIITPLLEVAL